MDDIQKVIRLAIADLEYPYRLVLGGKEEELTREAVRLVNEKVNLYRSCYPNLPKERYLAMVAFDFCYRWLDRKEEEDTKPYADKLKALTEELEEYFRKG